MNCLLSPAQPWTASFPPDSPQSAMLSCHARSEDEQRWYAVFTLPQHEKAVHRHLGARQIEAFLPTYEDVRRWKNRQRMQLVLPLFPTYLFVRIGHRERRAVLQIPHVIRIVGDRRGPVAISDSEIGFLRHQCGEKRLTPFPDPVIGERVRIVSGPFEGIEGTVVRQNQRSRFVLTLPLINQHAALEVEAGNLRPA